MSTMERICVIALAILSVVVTAQAKEPLKVFILAGQSNMQGTAEERTLKGIGMDPKTKPLYERLIDENGEPRVYKDVSIVYFDGKPDDPLIRHGALTAGFGARTRAGDKTGLEFAFGATIYEQLQEPILIIKTAWGGKDLSGHFRPPSAGPIFPDHSKVKPRKTNRGMMPVEQVIARAEKKQHVYYNAMVKHVNSVLADPGKYTPHYDKNAGYEIAGFVWFQGFNDMLQGGEKFYKPTDDRPQFAYYSELLAHFIRDVRKDFEAPKMPFVIGVIGIGGEQTDDQRQIALRKAMAATAEMPEFEGNVAAVQTAPFWNYRIDEIHHIKASLMAPEKRERGRKGIPYSVRDPEGKYAERRAEFREWYESFLATAPAEKDKQAYRAWQRKLKTEIDAHIYTPEERQYLEANKSNAALHYWGSGKTYSQIGDAFARALTQMNDF